MCRGRRSGRGISSGRRTHGGRSRIASGEASGKWRYIARRYLGRLWKHPFPEGQSPIRDLRGQEDSWREVPDRLWRGVREMAIYCAAVPWASLETPFPGRAEPYPGSPGAGGLMAGGPGSPLARRPGNGDTLRSDPLGISGKIPFPGRAEPYPGSPAAFTPSPLPWRGLRRDLPEGGFAIRLRYQRSKVLQASTLQVQHCSAPPLRQMLPPCR